MSFALSTLLTNTEHTSDSHHLLQSLLNYWFDVFILNQDPGEFPVCMLWPALTTH